MIGIPGDADTRIPLIPSDVQQLIQCGTSVYILKDAGIAAGFSDEDYINCNAQICHTLEELYSKSTVIVKASSPSETERRLLTEDHIVFGFFMVNLYPEVLMHLLQSKCTCICYDHMHDGTVYPVYDALQCITGDQAVREGMAHVSTPKPTITIIGADTVGMSAYESAKTKKAVKKVTLIETNMKLIRQLLPEGVHIAYASPDNIAKTLGCSDIVIGTKYPHTITKYQLNTMQPGSLFIDTTMEQGGMTDISDCSVSEIVTYNHARVLCHPDLSSKSIKRASRAISKSVTPYIIEIVTRGFDYVLAHNQVIRNGLIIKSGIKLI